MLGNPNDRDFLGMVHTQVIPNCPFNVNDCKHTAQIFGKNLPDVLGKTVRHKQEWVMPEYTDIPRDIIEQNKLIMLMGDIMFVNGLPFLITSACQIGLITTEYLPEKTAKHVANNLNWVIHL